MKPEDVTRRLVDAARLKRNTRATDLIRHDGTWVAVPAEDFDALRTALAAYDAAPDDTLTEAQRTFYEAARESVRLGLESCLSDEHEAASVATMAAYRAMLAAEQEGGGD